MARRTSIVVLSSLARAPELCFELLKVLVRKVLEIDEFIARVFDRANEFVQFQMDRFCIAVLRVLNQKHHQKRNDGRGRVNDELPCVGKMKGRSGNEPDNNDKHGPSKCPCAAEHHRGAAGENTERVADYAEEIVLFLVLSQFFELSLFHSITLASRPMWQLRAYA